MRANLDTQTLGNTVLKVTPMGLGLAALGRPAYINLGHAEDLPSSYQVDAMREHAHEVLDAAWQAGIRYFDAARSYGRAEEFLSSWLTTRGIRSCGLTVGSKWGYSYTADWQLQVPAGDKHEVKDHSVPVLNRQIRESRSTLGDHLDVYQIHSATLESDVLGNDEVLSRLAELRDAGLTIGFSTSGPQQPDTIRKGLAIERGGRPLFESVQATWNVLEQSACSALAEAHDAGRGVIVKEALANGRLTSRNTNANFRVHNERLYRFARDNGITIDAIAIACVLRQRWVSVVLSGAASTDHLVSNLKALDLVELAELDELLPFSESAATYWSVRSRLAWN
jgi:aryl-alcohol dehydrogenase-like predicted oxidoreductase